MIASAFRLLWAATLYLAPRACRALAWMAVGGAVAWAMWGRR